MSASLVYSLALFHHHFLSMGTLHYHLQNEDTPLEKHVLQNLYVGNVIIHANDYQLLRSTKNWRFCSERPQRALDSLYEESIIFFLLKESKDFKKFLEHEWKCHFSRHKTLPAKVLTKNSNLHFATFHYDPLSLAFCYHKKSSCKHSGIMIKVTAV